MNRDAGQRGGARGERGGQGLALTGLHLGDHALEQDPPADQLDVEVPLAQRPTRHLADQSEHPRDEIIGVATGAELRPDGPGRVPDAVVAEPRKSLALPADERGKLPPPSPARGPSPEHRGNGSGAEPVQDAHRPLQMLGIGAERGLGADEARH